MDVSAFVVSNPHASGGLLLGMIFWGMVSASRCVAPAQEAAEPQVEIISEDRVAPGYPPTVPVHPGGHWRATHRGPAAPVGDGRDRQ
jgi:hypothetical protein